MVPGAVNDSARALMAGIARYISDTNGSITTGGGSNIYTVTSLSGHTALTNGIVIAAKASFTNTGAATLNLNTIGAKSIRVFDSGAEGALVSGQIVINGTYQFRYDTAANSAAGAWILLNPSPDPTSQAGIGDVKVWPSNTAPTGWALCYGQELSQTTYAALFAILSTTYNTGGETAGNFRVPDLRGRIPAGKDNMGGTDALRITGSAPVSINGSTLGATGGAQSAILDTTQIPSHTHTGTTDADGNAHTHSGTTASGGVDHTHAQATPSTTNGQFSGPGSNGWGGTFPSNSTATGGASAFNHTHTFTTGTTTAHTHGFTTAATGGGSAHTNMPPIMIFNYIIKTG
jgi:microcystin-dependent protein